MDPTWIVRLDAPGDGPRLAVKDCIDVEGLPTTAGCQVVAEQAGPAAQDAPVVAAARRSGARIIGKTSLTGRGRDPGPGSGGVAVEDGESAGAPHHCLVGQPARLHQMPEQRVGFGGQGQAPHQASSRIVGAQHGSGPGELAQGAGRPAL